MHNRIKYLFIVLITLSVTTISAQTYFTLTPLLGIGSSFSKIKSHNTSDIKNNFASFFPRYGLLIDFHKNKFGFSTGISLSNSSATSYSNDHRLYSHRQFVCALPLFFSYDTKEFNLFYIKRIHVSYDEEELSKSNFFLMSFKLKPFAGLNIDFVENSNGGIEAKNGGYTYTETIQYSVVNRNGVSAMFGLTMQFLQKGKERMALSFYYNQGLTNYLNASYTYTENNISQTANVVSKGTYIALGLSYPIRVWDVDKRRAKKATVN